MIVPLQVVFEGVVGSSYRGDIAIDDISFTAGACGNPGQHGAIECLKRITIIYINLGILPVCTEP